MELAENRVFTSRKLLNEVCRMIKTILRDRGSEIAIMLAEI